MRLTLSFHIIKKAVQTLITDKHTKSHESHLVDLLVGDGSLHGNIINLKYQ